MVKRTSEHLFITVASEPSVFISDDDMNIWIHVLTLIDLIPHACTKFTLCLCMSVVVPQL